MDIDLDKRRMADLFVIRQDEALTCLAAEEMSLFSASGALRAIIEHFPDLRIPEKQWTKTDMTHALTLLVKHNILISAETAPRTFPAAEPEPLVLTLCLDHPGFSQPMDEHAACETALNWLKRHLKMQRLTVASAYPDKAIHTLLRIKSRLSGNPVDSRRKEGRRDNAVKWTLRSARLPQDNETLALLKTHDVFFEWRPSHKRLADVAKEADALGRLRKSRQAVPAVAVIPANAATEEETLQLFEILKNAGFYRCYHDLRCRARINDSHESGDSQTNAAVIIRSHFPIGWNTASDAHGFLNLFPIIRGLMTKTRRFYGCGAGISCFTAAPDLAIYPCELVCGEPEFQIKTEIHSGGALKFPPGYAGIPVYHRSECKTCQGRFLCGGGCPLRKTPPPPSFCRAFLTLMEHTIREYKRYNLNDRNMIITLTRQTQAAVPCDEPPQENSVVKMEKNSILTVQGQSMLPFLKEGDRVVVSPANGQRLKRGDIVCFGTPPACHRLIGFSSVHGDPMALEKGDNTKIGSWIPLQDVYGRVTAIQRPGKKPVPMDSPPRRLQNAAIAFISLAAHKYFSAKSLVNADKSRGEPNHE